jgi:GNAT superfamily N-acetyltransferase
MSQVELYRYLCGEPQNRASRALADWLSATDTDRSYLPMMQYRVAGKAAEQCKDIYYLAMDGDQILSRHWNGWGNHPHAVGNFGNFMTKEEFQGRGIGRKLLNMWYEDLMQQPDRPLGLFCSAKNGYLIDLYGGYGFTQAVVKLTYSMLYMPLDGSPATFPELCEDYYCTAQKLTVRPAEVQWRHEIDCLLKFALAAEGETLGLPGCNSLEEAIVWPQIGQAQLVFTEKDRPVGWSFTGADGITHWQLHPKYRGQFAG